MASLYAIAPLVPEMDPVLPDSHIFYTVAPLFNLALGAHGSAIGVNAKNDRLCVLEQRQLGLLARLEELKTKVLQACSPSHSAPTSAPANVALRDKAKVHNLPFTPTKEDVVVQTAPSQPALTSLAVALLLEVRWSTFILRNVLVSLDVCMYVCI